MSDKYEEETHHSNNVCREALNDPSNDKRIIDLGPIHTPIAAAKAAMFESLCIDGWESLGEADLKNLISKELWPILDLYKDIIESTYFKAHKQLSQDL